MTSIRAKMLGATLVMITLATGCRQSEVDASLVPEASSDPVLATWRGQVEVRKSEYESWLRWRELPDARANLVQFATGLVLSQAALQRNEDASLPSARAVVDRVREVVLSEALVESLRSKIEVTDAEIDEVLERKPDAFVRPRRFALSNIFLSYSGPGRDKANVHRRIQALRNRVLSGESFSSLAETESESQSRFRGGKLGLVKLDELPADVARVVGVLRVGELSPIIDSAGGLAIYFCERIDEPLIHPPEVVREKVRAALYEQKAGVMMRAFDDELRGRNDLDSTLDPHGRVLETLRANDAVSRGLHEVEAVRLAIRWRTMQQLALREMQRRALDRRKEPDVEALRKKFEAMRDSGRGITRHRVAGIAFGEATVDSAAQARTIMMELERGSLSFEDAARRFSTHESAQSGGDLGWFDRRRLATSDLSLMRAVRQMPVGALSGVLNSGTDLWIYKVVDRQNGADVKFEDMLPQLKRQYLQEQLRPLQRAVKKEIELELVFL